MNKKSYKERNKNNRLWDIKEKTLRMKKKKREITIKNQDKGNEDTK